MRYQYKCPECKTEIEIVKPMAESDHAEYCDKCEHELKRVYLSTAILTADGYKK